MKTAIIIPARYASSRLPGKPLLNVTGKFLIQHVYEQAAASRNAQEVIVATDDERIRDAVISFGGNVVMTSADHQSGTDRIAEVARQQNFDLIVNLQGDEPRFPATEIDDLIQLMQKDTTAGMATLATPLRSIEAYHSSSVVKVVVNNNGSALYFSRSPIPHVRDGQPQLPNQHCLHHLGIYAYRKAVLLELAGAPVHALEEYEKLEQLRALARGITIKVGVIEHAHRGVDTPEDYAAFVESWRASSAG
jgi:3-deoxy-manno-octulosonate cytidylyltransferase (CMP-KDO synthetase)